MRKPAILLATWNDGLFAIENDQCTNELDQQSVRGLASDGFGGALAIVGNHQLCRRGPDGKWTTIATSEIELSCCIAVGNAIYVGTDDAQMLRLSQNRSGLEVLDGFNKTAGRQTWFAGSAVVDGQRLGPPLGIRSLASTSDRRTLFANVHVGGIPRSTDDGTTWQPTIDTYSDVHEVCAHPSDPSIVAAAASAGLCLSRDAGATWAPETNGFHSSYCSAVAFSGDDILVSASTDHFATQGKLYRRPLRPNGTIVAVDGGLPTWTEGIVDTGCIAVRGSLIVMADRSGILYSSEDHGQSWSRKETGLKTPSSILIC